MRIVFMGTPVFAVPSLERLVEAGYRPEAVVTAPDKPRGRGQKVRPTPVKKAAERLEIDRILQPPSVRDERFAKAIAKLKPDLIVVVAFKILPPAVFETARIGAFNLHGSLLPAYRGAAPINRAIMNGETETGVTTFFLKAKVDTGDIIVQKKMDIGPDETAGELHDRMKKVGAEVVVETVQRIESGNVDPKPQDNSKASSAPKLHQEDCQIPWGEPAETVHNHIRGLSPYPGAWTLHGDTRLKVFRSKEVDGAEASGQHHPGEVVQADERLIVGCGEGMLEVMKIQQPGKKRLTADDFLRGYDLEPGEQFR